VRSADTFPPFCTAIPSLAQSEMSQSRRSASPCAPTVTPPSRLSRMLTPLSSGRERSSTCTALLPVRSNVTFSSRPWPPLRNRTPWPRVSATETPRRNGLLASTAKPGPSLPVTRPRSNSTVLLPPMLIPAPPRTVRLTKEVAARSSARTPSPPASSTVQSVNRPRALPHTWMPASLERTTVVRLTCGSEPLETVMPRPPTSSKRQSSTTARPRLERARPSWEVWWTCSPRRAVLASSSSATAGLAAPEISQSSMVPAARPLANTPLPRTSRKTQERTAGRPRSLMTRALVSTSSMTQSSRMLGSAVEITTPAPVEQVTRLSRIARAPEPRTTTAVHAEPSTSQSAISACPAAMSTTGRSSSWPRRTRPESLTASATERIALPDSATSSTLPRPSRATRVTTLRRVRLSS